MSEQQTTDWLKRIKKLNLGGNVSETSNAGDKVTAQASHAPEPDVINPPVEDIGQDDTQARVAAEIKKLQEEHDKLAKAKEAKEAKAAEEAKKAAQAAEAAKKVEASKPKPEKVKVQPQSDVQASLDRGPAGFSLSINATGKSLAECIKTAQQYISDLAAG